MRRATAVALALAAVLAIPASAGAAKGKDKGEKVTVMTRNVFLGADLNPAIQAASLNEAIDGAAEIYREVESTNFVERAVPLAKEIKKAKPDLVGLQRSRTGASRSRATAAGPVAAASAMRRRRRSTTS